MSTLLHAVHHEILDLITQLRNDEGDNTYISGECASLSLALHAYVANKHPGVGTSLQLIYRHEMDEDTEEENSRTLSHVVLGLDGETYDINGKQAVERWEEHVDGFDMDEGTYNELRITTLSRQSHGQDIATALAAHCDEFGLSLGKLPNLCERWGLTPPL